MTSDELERLLLEVTNGDIKQARAVLGLLQKFLADLRKELLLEPKS